LEFGLPLPLGPTYNCTKYYSELLYPISWLVLGTGSNFGISKPPRNYTDGIALFSKQRRIHGICSAKQHPSQDCGRIYFAASKMSGSIQFTLYANNHLVEQLTYAKGKCVATFQAPDDDVLLFSTLFAFRLFDYIYPQRHSVVLHNLKG
jgi:hypothetical protein